MIRRHTTDEPTEALIIVTLLGLRMRCVFGVEAMTDTTVPNEICYSGGMPMFILHAYKFSF